MKSSTTTKAGGKFNPYGAFPQLFPLAPGTPVRLPPDDAACHSLWAKYDMWANIKRHSLKVAKIATALAMRAASLGFPICVQTVRAAALLHDIAKTFTLRYGGSHSQIGAAWTLQETGNPEIARGVLLHVFWPWEVPSGPEICSLPFFIIYADKRVRHDAIVTLADRFEDLLARYGKNKSSIAGLTMAHEQALAIEKALCAQLGWKLDENTFDSRRLVHRAGSFAQGRQNSDDCPAPTWSRC